MGEASVFLGGWGGAERVEEPGGGREAGTTSQEAGRKQAVKYFSPSLTAVVHCSRPYGANVAVTSQGLSGGITARWPSLSQGLHNIDLKTNQPTNQHKSKVQNEQASLPQVCSVLHHIFFQWHLDH